ncbi:light-harvesting complex-like protein OHP2, chloroplastic [Durio zibethinus]|uniref:Light-harvesting complex-like protein OHP2, chloroplastic n=1 Tax=Durio zibethinus TaxID=66656 RepID=A0A6P6ASV6_DURZI|nr:light-harvesting complex-like protein OHP2, chloroplastic [Durio zibethinus]
MSMATSIPCLKIPNPSSSLSSSSSTSYRLPGAAKPYIVTIRSSQTEGPLRRPVAPSPPPPLKPVPPSPSSQPTPPSSPSPPPLPPPPAKAASVAAVGDQNVITLEFQRQRAKELQEYFKQKKLEESNQGPFFGFLGKNEIANGRWAMFGFAVGLLTEYATGSNFVDQVKIMLSNFGIIDLE